MTFEVVQNEANLRGKTDVDFFLFSLWCLLKHEYYHTKTH